jgi:hypothetical protein
MLLLFVQIAARFDIAEIALYIVEQIQAVRLRMLQRSKSAAFAGMTPMSSFSATCSAAWARQ